ncbi:MAG: sulfatase-like hydrolase/transferase, partial [Planctomycetes bacterium]|nr:sulfatase-like hydrolase/transferase [Planctomycetota bacterium]
MPWKAQRTVLLICVALLTVLSFIGTASAQARHPNVILVMTDDQGYGDMGAHGNTMIQTPHL